MIRKSLLAIALLLPVVAAGQQQPAIRFSHTGSFAVSVDDDSEMNLARGLANFDASAYDRAGLVLRIDFRPPIGRDRIEKKLRASPDLRAAITYAIKLQISAQTGIKDLSLINVPAPVVDAQVAKYVDDHITSEAVAETSLREVFLRLALGKRLSDIGRDVPALFLEVGKVDPVHAMDTDFTNNPTQGLYYFAVSQPAVRLKGQVNRSTMFYAQSSNDRHGSVEDASGSDVIGFTKDVISGSSGKVLDFSINSYEVGVVQKILAGSLVAAGGRRPQRDLLTRGELSDSYYGVAWYKGHLEVVDFQVQATVEEAGDADAIKRGNFLVSRTFFDERMALGTQFFVREGGDQARIRSALAGVNYKLVRTPNFEFGGGVKYSRFEVGSDTGYRAEAGIGIGWMFR